MLPSKHHGHRRADLRNLHLHRAALAKLRDDDSLRVRCLELAERWLASPDHRASRPWLEEWRKMLRDWPVDRIADVVLDEDGGQTLRQCSPLGPTLTPQERWSLFREIGARIREAEAPKP